MHIHILGICGTFMGGLARLAIEKGFKVTGSDQNCYPPMSTQLESLGIVLHQGYDAEQLDNKPDCVVVGNALSRGQPVIESLLNSNQVYRSGPQWLSENILQDKWVIAVAGTHGKTSTASMVAWILEELGYKPGFLIGGVMENFAVSARLTDSPFFVVEADEYDTAFFDKRSKFVHYRGRTCILNNLEFDHADIFNDISDIENQFHHLVRTIPENGLIIRPKTSDTLDRVIQKGCWSSLESFSENRDDQDSHQKKSQQQSDWQSEKLQADASQFSVFYKGEVQGDLKWPLIGDHNMHNALAAIAACHHTGVMVDDAIQALASFKNVKRRMELIGCVNNIHIYDDFAHHPTAIATTLQGLRNQLKQGRIIAAVDLRSNTMKMGLHQDSLADAVEAADYTLFHLPVEYDWKINFKDKQNLLQLNSSQAVLDKLIELAQPGDTIIIMSNGSFDGIHQKVLTHLEEG